MWACVRARAARLSQLRWCARTLKRDKQRLFTEPPPSGGKHCYSVLQAVVANGATKAYDALVSRSGGIRVRLADVPRVYGLSPLRLAAKLGKTAMLEHVLSTSKIHMWTWGPVSSYTIPLDEIDTAFAQAKDGYIDLQVSVHACGGHACCVLKHALCGVR